MTLAYHGVRPPPSDALDLASVNKCGGGGRCGLGQFPFANVPGSVLVVELIGQRRLQRSPTS